MVGDPYEVFDDPYRYPGTNVLKNRAGLRDAETLEQFELEMVALRAEEGPPRGNFTHVHYRRVHRHLFQDVYDWAGKDRTIRTGKGGNWFCFPEHIDGEMARLFAQVKRSPFLPGARPDGFVPALAHFLGELNAIHPFREGNGRIQLVFARMLGLRSGNPIRLASIEAEPFLAAMIASFAGDLAPLIDELQRLSA